MHDNILEVTVYNFDIIGQKVYDFIGKTFNRN